MENGLMLVVGLLVREEQEELEFQILLLPLCLIVLIGIIL